jgi:hypothetical protein
MSKVKAVEKKKPARIAAGPEAPGFARSMGENTGRLLRPMFPLLLVAGMFVGVSVLMWRPVYGEGGGGDSVEARGRLNAKLLRAAILQKKRPDWISPEDYAQIADIGLLAQNHSVFEPGLSRALAQAYESNSWVERVNAVRLRYPARIEIEIEWRKPVARVAQTSMVLDRNGYVLNLMSDSANVRDTPLIGGVGCLRTEAGKQVPEKDLLDALGLLRVVREALSSSPGGLRVASLQRVSAAMWHVQTDRGPLVYWGAFTDDPPMDEPTTHEKADLLRRRLCEIKDPGLLEYIKVYHAKAVVKPRALSAPVAESPRRY